VQDCVYEIYEDYCDYETMAWVMADTVTTQGTDVYATWPDPNLTQSQRISGRSESYTIYFDANGQSYILRTSDYEVFQQATPGSTWKLAVNKQGDVRKAEPQN